MGSPGAPAAVAWCSELAGQDRLHTVEQVLGDQGLEVAAFSANAVLGHVHDADAPRRRELYRPARLTLDDVAFLVIEPPDITYPWLKAGRIRIDAGEGQPPQSSSTLPVAPAAPGRLGCTSEN